MGKMAIGAIIAGIVIMGGAMGYGVSALATDNIELYQNNGKEKSECIKRCQEQLRRDMAVCQGLPPAEQPACRAEAIARFHRCGVNCGVFEPRKADLSITKTVDEPTPVLGENVAFTIQIKNEGPFVSPTVEVKDVLPDGLEFVLFSTSDSSDYDKDSGLWIIRKGGIERDETRTLIIVARATLLGEITNTAEVTDSFFQDPDSTPNNHIESEDDQQSVSINVQVPSCEDGCELEAEKEFDDCIASIGNVEICRARADTFLAQCLLQCNAG